MKTSILTEKTKHNDLFLTPTCFLMVSDVKHTIKLGRPTMEKWCVI